MKNLLLILRAASGTLAFFCMVTAMLCPFIASYNGTLGEIAFCAIFPFFLFGITFAVCDEKINF